MKSKLSAIALDLLTFLNEKKINQGNILLACSGGADSMALAIAFQELLERAKIKIKPIVVHVDHGWRESSAQEAERVREYFEHLGWVFECKRLETKEKKSDLENQCRKERMDFFQKIYQKWNCQALFLGHHADDQIETILKRLFEGAGLWALSAIKSTNIFGNMQALRPFLRIKKSLLIQYCENKNVSFIEDSSNLDPQFLRGRFRTQILPFLEKNFEKSIGNNLLEFQEQVCEWQEYVQALLDKEFKKKVEGLLGAYWKYDEQAIFLTQLFIKEFLEQKGFIVSRCVRKNIAHFLHEGSANKQFPLKQAQVCVDRSVLYYLPALPAGILFEPCSFQGQKALGKWVYSEPVSQALPFAQAFLRGRLYLPLVDQNPVKILFIKDLKDVAVEKKIKKNLLSDKVPNWAWQWVPLIKKGHDYFLAYREKKLLCYHFQES